jgi:hypothetical protein
MKMADKTYEFYVAGIKFHQYPRIKPFIKEGDKVLLIPDPENQYDPNAVKIIYRTGDEFIMLGHVPMKKDLSRKISGLINASISDPDWPGDPYWTGTVTYHGLDAPSYQALEIEVSFNES